MATNVYQSEQRVAYRGTAEPPTSFFGWEYSFSGGIGTSLHVFNMPEYRDRFIAKVKEAIGDAEIHEGADVEELAAIYALHRYGDDCTDAYRPRLDAMLGESALELLEDAFEDFDLSELEEETAGHA
jgi:hypothetical protein